MLGDSETSWLWTPAASQVSSEAGPISQMRRLRSRTTELLQRARRLRLKWIKRLVWLFVLTHCTMWELRRLHGRAHTPIRTQREERDRGFGESPYPFQSLHQSSCVGRPQQVTAPRLGRRTMMLMNTTSSAVTKCTECQAQRTLFFADHSDTDKSLNPAPFSSWGNGDHGDQRTHPSSQWSQN